MGDFFCFQYLTPLARHKDDIFPFVGRGLLSPGVIFSLRLLEQEERPKLKAVTQRTVQFSIAVDFGYSLIFH